LQISRYSVAGTKRFGGQSNDGDRFR
jgi:hypothetical protein